MHKVTSIKPKKKYLVDIAYERILYMIMKGQFPQNMPLVETDLAEQLNMSRTPIHEAITQLSTEGYLNIIPKKGAFLKAMTFDELIMGYEALEGLEGMASKLVAEKIKNNILKLNDLLNMKLYIDQMEKANAEHNLDAWIQADTNFHKEISILSGNEYIIKYISTLQNQFTFVSTSITPYFIDKTKANQEHKAIYEAIKSGNPDESQLCACLQRRGILDYLKSHTSTLNSNPLLL